MKLSPISIRFEEEDLDAIRLAAKQEGLEPAAYVRRCSVLYTREKHPDSYRQSELTKKQGK
jgi:predicted DNA binding CopG/RHH family protein